jgi:acyl-CoA synthetase (AMP-forming)/AMP-acid ligase II
MTAIPPAPPTTGVPEQGSPRPRLDDARWRTPRYRDQVRILFREARALSLATLPERIAALYGARPAFFLDAPIDTPVVRGDCVTCDDFARLVARTAHGLARLGVRAGERVGLVTRNRIECAFAEFAAAKLGAVGVPLNALLRAEELRKLAGDACIETLVVDRAVCEETLRGDLRGFPTVARWVVATDADAPPHAVRFADLLEGEAETFPCDASLDGALGMIFYTAGTTGLPKGALLSHGALFFAIRRQARMAAWIPARRRTLALLVMPLAHTSGHQAMLFHLALGTPMLLHGRFEARRVLDAIERHRVTQISGVPAMYRMLLDAGAAERDLASLEIVAWGGDAMPPDLHARFAAAVRRSRPRGARWVSGYGLAETAGQQTRWMGQRDVAGAVGRPLGGVEVRIAGEDGHPVARGAVGELWVRSPGVMQGYWNAPDETNAALTDGWLRTGDLARRGRFGRLYLVSRKKERIKVGGYSVFPAEVEHALAEHPDVLQVAVVGVPHAVKGQVPAAAVVPRPQSGLTEAALLAWAHERVAAYKAPRHVVFVESIPMSSAWKPKRHEVAELLRPLLEGR